MDIFNEIKEILESATEDAEKFYEKGNASAGTRLRGAYSAIAKLCKDGRKDVSEVKNSRKESK